jgi:hypothetical protein
MTRVPPVRFIRLPIALGALALTACDDSVDTTCTPDGDGILGTERSFFVRITDDAFEPALLTAQNLTQATLQIENATTEERDFSVDCVQTPNDRGCPAEWCFPDSANAPAIAPGESVSVAFEVPRYEAIYTFRSGSGEGALTGQFVVN